MNYHEGHVTYTTEMLSHSVPSSLDVYGSDEHVEVSPRINWYYKRSDLGARSLV